MRASVGRDSVASPRKSPESRDPRRSLTWEAKASALAREQGLRASFQVPHVRVGDGTANTGPHDTNRGPIPVSKPFRSVWPRRSGSLDGNLRSAMWGHKRAGHPFRPLACARFERARQKHSYPENLDTQIWQGGWAGCLLQRRSVAASNGALEQPGKNQPNSPTTRGTPRDGRNLTCGGRRSLPGAPCLQGRMSFGGVVKRGCVRWVDLVAYLRLSQDSRASR